jgi:hypothetical protein
MTSIRRTRQHKKVRHVQTTNLPLQSLIAVSPSVSTPPVCRRHTDIIMNSTIIGLGSLSAIPVTLFRIATNALPVSYVQIPHIKLKAEHQALVLFHIFKIGMAYWEGWREGKKNSKDEDDSAKEVKEEAKRKEKRQNKIFMRGKYTVIFQ